VEYEIKSGTGNNGGEWNAFKITLTKPEQHIGKARNSGSIKKNSHTSHCTHTTENDHVEIQTKFRG
jgi:hypothetical protein